MSEPKDKLVTLEDLETAYLSLKKRIDGLSVLMDDDVSKIEELNDIRTGDDGVTYPSAGVSVRSQFANIKKDIENLQNNINTIRDQMVKCITNITLNQNTLSFWRDSDLILSVNINNLTGGDISDGLPTVDDDGVLIYNELPTVDNNGLLTFNQSLSIDQTNGIIY